MRPPTDDDFDDVVRVFAAQDMAWFDEVDMEADDVRAELDRVVAASGSLGDGARLAVADGRVIGLALHVGHGQTNLAIDPAAPMAMAALERLTGWLLESGAELVDAPAQDTERLAVFAAHGLEPIRSSFDLERSSELTDLTRTELPSGITFSPFRKGVDDQEAHDVIYSVWMDVPGHTDRPIEEWRSLFLDGPSFDPELVVVARRTDGAIAGIAICRVFNGEIGWVAQLAVGRPDRGVGLGRALLVEALYRLATRNVGRLGLSVEAANDTALGLYRSVGLEVSREWVHCAPA